MVESEKRKGERERKWEGRGGGLKRKVKGDMMWAAHQLILYNFTISCGRHKAINLEAPHCLLLR